MMEEAEVRKWKGKDYFYFLLYSVYNARYINSVYYSRSIQQEETAKDVVDNQGMNKTKGDCKDRRDCKDCLELIRYYAGEKTQIKNGDLKDETKTEFKITTSKKSNSNKAVKPTVKFAALENKVNKNEESYEVSSKKYHLAWLRAIISFTNNVQYYNNETVMGWSNIKDCILKGEFNGCLVKHVLDKSLKINSDAKNGTKALDCYGNLLEYLKSKIGDDPMHWLNEKYSDHDALKKKGFITTHMSRSPLNRHEVTVYIFIHNPKLISKKSDDFDIPPVEIEKQLIDLIPHKMVDYHPNFENKRELYTPSYLTAYEYVNDWKDRHSEGLSLCNELKEMLVKLKGFILASQPFCDTPNLAHKKIQDNLRDLRSNFALSKETHELPSIDNVKAIIDQVEYLSMTHSLTLDCCRGLIHVYSEVNQSLTRNLITANFDYIISNRCTDKDGNILPQYQHLIPDDLVPQDTAAFDELFDCDAQTQVVDGMHN